MRWLCIGSLRALLFILYCLHEVELTIFPVGNAKTSTESRYRLRAHHLLCARIYESRLLCRRLTILVIRNCRVNRNRFVWNATIVLIPLNNPC